MKTISVEEANLIPYITDEDELCVNHPTVVTNQKTLLCTTGMGPCVGLAIFIEDIHGTKHRIIYHCPFDLISLNRLSFEVIKRYMNSIGEIIKLKAAMASFNTFFEKELCDFDVERDKVIINIINELFSFWKENNPDFDIDIYQSDTLGVTPDGKFGIMSDEDKYEEYLIEQAYDIHKSDENFNTIFSTESIKLSTAMRRLEDIEVKKR